MRRATLLLAAMLAALLLAGGAALAGPKTVDPDTLEPPPPPGAECKQTGNYVICHTFGGESWANQPDFTLSCGRAYTTGSAYREGIRWYSAEGLLLKRFVTEDVEGSWSLSPTGGGPTVRFFAHDNWTDVYAIPGDEQSVSTTYHGDTFTAMAPGSGVLWHIAGQDLPDGTHRGAGGAFFIDDEGNVDPEADAALCEALQR